MSEMGHTANMNMFRIVVICGLLLLSTQLVAAFNVDTANYIQHEGQSQSMFGFSVALHQESHRSW